jgi:hypothetical protein
MRRRLLICSVAVAVVGLLGAVLIYVTAGEDSDENVQIVIVDGKAYKVPLASTKAYQRELRRIGGEAAVLFDDINRFFAGVFRGRSLAIIMACITIFVSGGLFLAAREMPSGPHSDDRGNDAEPG